MRQTQCLSLLESPIYLEALEFCSLGHACDMTRAGSSHFLQSSLRNMSGHGASFHPKPLVPCLSKEGHLLTLHFSLKDAQKLYQ